MPVSHSSNTVPSRRLRRGALAISLWLFSLSTTVLLLGLWGRTVAGDREAIEAGTRAVLESEAVSDRITGWIVQGLSDGSDDLPEGLLAEAVTEVWNHPDSRLAVEDVVTELVEAAMAPPGSSVSVDVSELIRPLAPVVVRELSERGVALDAGVVEEVLSSAPTVVLGADADVAVVSAVGQARAALTRVVAIAVIGMAAAGVAAIALADERMSQLRGLAIRVVVSAMTFALLLRISAWALDPGGGRSPLAAGGSVLLSRGLHVLLIAVLIAGGVGVFAAVETRRRRRAMAV